MGNRLLVIFDLDGTLVDSREDIAESVNMARRQLGLAAMPNDDIIGAVGDGIDVLVERCFGPAEPAVLKSAMDALMAVYAENVALHTRPYKGIEDMLRELHARGFSKAIVSNKPTMLTKRLLHYFGWDEAFRVIFGADSTPRRKPDPQPLLEARDRAGVDKDARIIMVGDGWQDMAAGKAAGATCVWVSWGFTKSVPPGADHVIAAPEELVGWLLKLNS